MSNLLDQNPLIIDTQQTESVKTDQADATVKVHDGAFQITKVYWKKPTTATHLATIKNKASGKVVLAMECEVENQSQVFDFNPPLVVPDIIVDDLDSGVVYIYIKSAYSARG